MPSVGIQTDEPEPPPPLIIYLPTPPSPPPPTTTTTTTQPEPEPNQLQQGRTHQLELEDVASWPPLPPGYFNAVGQAHGRWGSPSKDDRHAVNCLEVQSHEEFSRSWVKPRMQRWLEDRLLADKLVYERVGNFRILHFRRTHGGSSIHTKPTKTFQCATVFARLLNWFIMASPSQCLLAFCTQTDCMHPIFG